MEMMARKASEGKEKGSAGGQAKEIRGGSFRMPLHYPRYTRADYETMPEWKLDCLPSQYGLPVLGNLEEKRSFAMGAFLWPTTS
ncbi:hypothetical protein COCNU_scaffold055464G000020 [Cocos nucifera]|nr:hypothetical protein [Cocos nucifera]